MRKRKWKLVLGGLLILLPLAFYVFRPRQVSVRVVFTGDVRGRLEPCGCFEGQMGGLTRIDSLLITEGTEGDIRLDVGDSIAGREDYHVLHHHYVLEAFGRMGFDALNIGAREAQLTAEQLRTLNQRSPVPVVSANVLCAATGQRLFKPYVTLKRGGHRIAVVGVLDQSTSTAGCGQGVVVEDMFTSLNRVIPELKKKVGVIILLAFADEQRLAELARQFYEVDLILGGDVAQPSQELVRTNRSLILYVTGQAKALGVLDAEIRTGGRLKPIAHDMHLVNPLLPQAPRILRLADAYRQDIRTTPLDIDSQEYLRADSIPGVRQYASYTGTAACKACHKEAYTVWEGTQHSRAFQALVPRKADADPNCVGCHTVGFGSPDGYRREYAGRRLVNVGCESCHGPGSLHVARMESGTANDFRFRPLGAGDCRTCHHGEFSRPFHWEPFWERVRH